jgi:hypothetical protein
MTSIPICRPVQLPTFEQRLRAGRLAERINPANKVHPAAVADLAAQFNTHIPINPEHTAVLNSAWWGSRGVQCTVGFLERVPADFQRHFLEHANAWAQYANVEFTSAPAGTRPMLRVTVTGDGYWSFLGPQILTIPDREPTMCLQDFHRGMPESEWVRVVRHEVGHTLGLIHEHALPEIIALLDREATIRKFMASQGWPRSMVIEQILTPPAPGTYRSRNPSQISIMCYQFEADCTLNHRPIPGGRDITPDDGAFVGDLYPKAAGLVPMSGDEILARLVDVL